LPAEDRRHYVAWSESKPADFEDGYWTWMWNWYDEGGDRHVAAYLQTLDISDFDPKAAPPKTPAFWSIVNANRTSEEGELQDVLDALGTPDATTIEQIRARTPIGDNDSLWHWLGERKNRKAINHRLENCGYHAVINEVAKDGLWRIAGRRQVVYAKAELPLGKQQEAAITLLGRVAEVAERISKEEKRRTRVEVKEDLSKKLVKTMKTARRKLAKEQKQEAKKRERKAVVEESKLLKTMEETISLLSPFSRHTKPSE
jgi:hypothetical protein